jgi:hypothetical protein
MFLFKYSLDRNNIIFSMFHNNIPPIPLKRITMICDWETLAPGGLTESRLRLFQTARPCHPYMWASEMGIILQVKCNVVNKNIYR